MPWSLPIDETYLREAVRTVVRQIDLFRGMGDGRPCPDGMAYPQTFVACDVGCVYRAERVSQRDSASAAWQEPSRRHGPSGCGRAPPRAEHGQT